MFAKNFVRVYSDIFYLWHSEYLELIPEDFRNTISPSALLGKLKKVLFHIVRDLTRLLYSSAAKEDQILVFVSTKNNYDAVSFLNGKDEFYFLKPLFSELEAEMDVISYRFKFLYSVLSPLFLWKYLRESSNSKAKKYWDYSFQGIGLFEESVRWLKKNRPKAIIFSNDHAIFQRAMLQAAKTLSIPTVYIQHASASKYFPPLNFDLNLLEGEASEVIYRSIGSPEGEIKLVGMPKFDHYSKVKNTSSQIERIGICFNKLDHLSNITDFVSFLVENLNQEIIIRPHPADKRQLPSFEGVTISDSKKVDSFTFLQSVDAIIAGNTSIHLEAVLLNVLSIHYEFSAVEEKLHDIYGYIANGLSIHIKEKANILSFIRDHQNKKPDVYDKASYYNAAVSKVKPTLSRELVEQHLQNFFDH